MFLFSIPPVKNSINKPEMLCLAAGKWKQACDFPADIQDEPILAQSTYESIQKW